MEKGPGILAGFGRENAPLPASEVREIGNFAQLPHLINLSWPGFPHGAGQVWARAIEKVGGVAGFPWSSPDICAGCQTRLRFSGSPCNPFGRKEPISHGQDRRAQEEPPH